MAKHSRARHAVMELSGTEHGIRLRVADDGVGGAAPGGSGGLAGLADRVRTVDGRIEISSPPDGPTVVVVSLPSGANPCAS